MKYVYALLIALVCMTGCTARQATTTTAGFIAAGACGAFGIDMDPYTFSSMAEGATEMGFDAADKLKEEDGTDNVEESEDMD